VFAAERTGIKDPCASSFSGRGETMVDEGKVLMISNIDRDEAVEETVIIDIVLDLGPGRIGRSMKV